MNIKNKLKENNGSSMILVIVGLAILSISFGTVFSMMNNQLLTTKDTYDNVQDKYEAEAGIEESIANVQSQIMDKLDGSSTTFRMSEEEYLLAIKNRLISAKYKISEAIDADLPNTEKNNLKSIRTSLSKVIESINLDNALDKVEDIKEIHYEIMKAVNSSIINNKDYKDELKSILIYNNNDLSALDELEIAVDNIYIYDHIECDIKVEYDSDGLPNKDSFKDKIWDDIVMKKKDAYDKYMGKYYTNIRQYYTSSKILELSNELSIIRNNINAKMQIYNSMDESDFIILVDSLNEMTRIINDINREIYLFYVDNANTHGTLASVETLEEILESSFELKYDKTYEILCRLGKLSVPEIPDVEEPDTEEPSDEKLKIYVYDYKVENNNLNLDSNQINSSKQEVEIGINKSGNDITSVDMDELKDIEIVSTLQEKGKDVYKITAIVDFDVDVDTTKPSSERCNLKYEIKSYTKQKL